MIKNLGLIALFACVVAAHASAYADEAGDIRTISVQAEGEAKAQPDKVDVMLAVNERASTLDAAKKATDAQLKALYQIAKDMGIAEKDMQTTYSAVQPEYRYEDKSNRRVMEGYSVNHQVTVTLRKVDDLGKFIEAVLASGIDEIENLAFGIQNTDALKEEALKQAIAKAKRKADVMAAAAGTTVGPVVAIEEEGAVRPAPMPRMRVKAMAMESADAAPTPPAGEMSVRANVSVTYELNH